MSKHKNVWLALLVFLTALLPRITTLQGAFIVNDEPLYWDWSNEFINALVDLDWYGTLVGIGYPSITVVWVHSLGAALRFVIESLAGYPPAGFWQRAALDQPLVFDLLGQRRLVMGVVNALLILLIYWQAKKLMGQAIALLGAVLMALAPFLLADARTMRGDALMSALMLASSLEFLIFLREHRRRQLLFSGLAFGLALLTKMTALPVAGFVGLATSVYLFRRPDLTWPARLRWGVTSLAGWGIITALTLFIFWPALWVAPLEVFFFMRDYAADSIDGRLNFFWGELTHDEPLPLFYPNAFLFRATPLLLLGVAVTTALAVASLWRLFQARLQGTRPNLNRLWRFPSAARWTLLALGLYSVLYWLVLNAGALKRDRYLMPIFPAVSFIAAAGLLWLITWLARRWPGRNLPHLLAGGRWVWALFSLLFMLQVGHILSTHPFYYTYWNPLMGGGAVAMNVMMAEGGVDSAALVYLDRRPNAENETVALLTSRDYAPAFSGDTVRLTTTGRWITADHVVLRQYHYQTEKMDPDLLEYLRRHPPEHVVQFQGYTWAWVYPGPAAQYYAGSLLDGQAKLLGYNLSSHTAAPGRPLNLKLFWENHGYQPENAFFVRLVDAGGFAWAETTAQPLPDFAPVAAHRGAIVESEARLEIPAGTPPGLYFLKIGLAGGEDELDIGEFTLPPAGSRIALEPGPGQPDLALERRLDKALSPDLTLLGAAVEAPLILTAARPQRLTLYWQAADDISQDYLLSVHLLDPTGREAASWLGQPARGLYPTSSWQQGQLVRDPWLLDLAGQPIPPGEYTLQVALLEDETGPAVGQAALGAVELIDRRRIFEIPPMDHQAEVHLGDSISLLGYDYEQAPLTGGARLTTRLYWQAQAPIERDYTVFVQVIGPDGALIGQHDTLPANGRLPTTVWEPGEIIPDRHQIDFPIAQPGPYQVIVGMYDAATGERLPLTAPDGGPGGDFWQLHTFTITAADL